MAAQSISESDTEEYRYSEMVLLVGQLENVGIVTVELLLAVVLAGGAHRYYYPLRTSALRCRDRF